MCISDAIVYVGLAARVLRMQLCVLLNRCKTYAQHVCICVGMTTEVQTISAICVVCVVFMRITYVNMIYVIYQDKYKQDLFVRVNNNYVHI